MDDTKVKCPHCDGKTKCDCSSCGDKIIKEKDYSKAYSHWYEYGICKVCNGLGVIDKSKLK